MRLSRKFKAAFIFMAAFLIAGTVQAQSLNDFLNSFSRHNSEKTKIGKNGASLSNSEVTSGLKQALEIGTRAAAQKLSHKDGFFKDAAVKILMPPEAQKVVSTLRSIGMGSLVDEAILSMNRAAEDAASKSAPIFLNAIKGMTIQDGFQILNGGNNAATMYLQRKTTPALSAAFSPVIEQSLGKVGATKVWKTVFDTYNQIPFIQQKVNPDLTGYVTQQALKGVFTEIAVEELKIRTNPADQVTSLLKKVFGNKK